MENENTKIAYLILNCIMLAVVLLLLGVSYLIKDNRELNSKINEQVEINKRSIVEYLK